MTILVTGISGYVGSLVADRLCRDGHDVRGFARRPEAVSPPPGVELVAGDAVTGAGLQAALDGVGVAYFLIHSMESAGDTAFAQRERTAAENFATAARDAGVRRIVYLGGPVPPGPPSPHLASRLAVERILLDAVADSVALRASIVIGARSRSFRLLVRLVERMPVLPVPAWGANRTAPVDERDVLAMLVAAADLTRAGGGEALDAAGPEVVSYADLLRRLADVLILDRPALSLHGLSVTPLAGVLAAAIAGEDPGLVRPLMESLETDLLASGPSAATVLGVRLHSLTAALEHALGDWERDGPLRGR